MNASAGLVVSSLEVWRGERHLFSDLDFAVSAGEMALVSGPNGAGKTTLLRTLAGLTPPLSGQVEWRGVPVRKLRPEGCAEVGYLGHQDGLKRNLSIAENLRFYAALWQGESAVDPVLAEVGLAEFGARQVRYLSAGQKRRAALACLRLRNADLWLLDEPLTNLDADGVDLVTGWLGRHRAAGGCAVIATHRSERLRDTASLEIEL